MIWLLIGLMALVAVAALLWPLLKTQGSSQGRAAYNLAVFQDQLKDVDRDISRGVLTPAEADAARLEIQRRILAADRAPAENPTTDSRARRIVTAALVAIVVPALAGGIYMQVGGARLTAPGTLTAADETQSANGANQDEINKMVVQLAAKVADNPTDAEGVTLLARTYRQLGRFKDAAGAYKQLLDLKPDADTYSSYGEVLVAAADGPVSKEAHDSFVKALSLDRSEPRARFYLGLEQAEKNQPKNAIAIWRDLTASAPADAPWLGMVREQMAGVAQAAGIPPMTVEAKNPLDFVPTEEIALARMQAAAPPKADPAPAPAVSGSALQGRMSPEQINMIEGMVSGLAARLETSPEDYNGWMMLGRSYTVLKNSEGAMKAYDKAIALKPGEVEPRLQLMAFIMTSVDPDAPAPLPRLLNDTAAGILKINPAQPEALYVSGLGAAKAGDKAGARAHWTKAQNAMADDSPLKADMARRLKALD